MREKPPAIMTVEEAADLLKVETSKIWVWIQEGELQAAQLGQNVRIRYTDICSFLRKKVITEGRDEKKLSEHLALMDRLEGRIG